MWNDLYPDNPVHDMCQYGYEKDSTILESLPKLATELTTLAERLTEENPIWEEIHIFRNIQAQYKRILHCDKCIQLLERVGVCLRKMVLVNLSKAYLDLAEKILIEFNSSNDDSSYFLPSRQQLEFVLIRTQTAAKLICEALHYSRKAFCFLIQKLKVGHLIINLMMATSVTARLNIVFKSLLVQSFQAYRILIVWRNKLKVGGHEWPNSLDLPDDLETWINLEDSEYLKPKHLPKDQLEFLNSIFTNNSNQNYSNSEEGKDEVVYLHNAISDYNTTASTLGEENECIFVEDDEEMNLDDGVPVDRSEFENANSYVSISDKEADEPEVIPDVEMEESVRFTEAQKELFEKIESAKNMKQLQLIWNNLDVTSKDLVPKGLTPVKIRKVEKVFHELQRSVSHLKKSEFEDKKKRSKILLKEAKLKFAELLQLLPNECQFKPAKKFKELRNLYKIIFEKLKHSNDSAKRKELKTIYKNRRADIQLLVENNEKSSAKELIHSTSKLFLIKFLK